VAATAAPLAPSRVPIPGGSFSAGSDPGRFERDPGLEPRLGRTALGPFEIDVLPYSLDGRGPLLGVGRDEATQRCADRGGRLCTELEWERACKGPQSHPFPSGAELDPACRERPGCASGFGVWGFSRAPEWTASDLVSRGDRLAVVRGGAPDDPDASPALRRCSHRAPRAPEPVAAVAFRCCYGPPNAARVQQPKLGAAFGKRELSPSELAKWLASDAASAELARDVSYFPDPGGVQDVLARGGVSAPGLVLTTAPLSWNPAAGVELLVIAARSGANTSFVVVFDILGDGTHQLASSFIMDSEPGPVALAYDPRQRARLSFSTCWACPGETGKILYEDPDRTQIIQP
jgi:hypothetical protein